MNELNFRTLDLNLLRVFDEVMVERNLTRAAHNLAMTQPAVSNALKRLREKLGDELVRRSGYGVEPTPMALTLWPTVRDALQQLRESLAPGGFDPANAHNAFVLAMADATAAKLVPGMMDILENEAPGVNLRVLPLTTRDPRDLLESGLADLAIGHFPGVLAELGASHLQEHSPRFLNQRLYDGEYVVVMRRGHPLAGHPIDLDSYCAARHLLVSFSGRPFGFVDEALAALSRQRRVVLTVNQFFTAGRVVATTDLLTVLPRHFVGATGMEDELALSELPLPVPAVHVDTLWHRQTSHSSAHSWLRHTVMRASVQGFRVGKG
ncbi:LysR family transcriptional regulator [Hydrogenophaga sp.]|jgi:DNA-binding transcriptional LysR family regulator|uniref:LysR family transcriptional regulator n=1 Tax=Hydrogenophaga sp. TaxID=1904254 RepID=UPI002726A508|nr:LysR family transcriptional regulator [Hydrogenophaga sp.]MDO9146972.1 LysR family transcriptional regulator [Hydrogenophaga sp.]MDP2407403.1 LysR family transcriptional regulator [Hydrogenophaga sp.]MDP3326363.1 LysR family transcriptional regulator [Hydrogenophaga sp.]MDP3885160.1 LysR family transcriptional regulator [Hydrogenophaga sp.]MDZ4173325.1 LysR family transcriptional regulator [Hydrogenophaga sp.]